MTFNLAEHAVAVLNTADAHEKAALSRETAKAWFAARGQNERTAVGTAHPPDHPARPDRPELVAPRDVPKRRPG
ncbi:MAG: ferritin-like domain-containing protein, partial [Marinosulfonomonas sp.]|nr:ferritin-like domain-containing protein [Marinosulfonomonas sp.]